MVGGEGTAENGGAGWTATRHARGQLTSCIEALSNSTIQVSAGVGGDEVAAGGRHSSTARTFNVDYAFGADATQHGVYETSVAPLLARFVEGYNVTVLAYGQTSSGKTHTMGTDGGEAGIVPRALQWLFAWAQAGGHGAGLRRGVDIRISFIEVYNEDLIDLVAQAQGHGVRPPIFVREDAKGNILWTGVQEVAVASAEAAMGILADGSRERQTWGTRMNATSSRSHAIYSVSLTQTRARESVRIVSKLHFVDLAGSERLKKTMAVGERQREGISINSGLLALGNVISALGDTHRGPLAHVPYRESKLTYMLRDSLGGSAQTLLIACVSAAEANAAESINTLKYAARARNIRNRGGVN
ncbi:kinesin-domain-containing protein, partial [Coemansia reversa NRRL 1564]